MEWAHDGRAARRAGTFIKNGIKKWQRALVRAVCVAAILAVANICNAAAGLSAESPQLQAVLPLGQEDMFVLLPVSLNDEIYHFALTCRTTHHVFDSNLQRLLPPPLKEITVNRGGPDATQVTVHHAPRFAVANIVVTADNYVFSANLEVFRELSGVDIRGIIGAPFFKGRIVQIDFDERVLRVFAPDAVPGSWGSRFALTVRDDGTLSIDSVTVAGLKETFSIDTGSSGNIQVHHWLFRQLLVQGKTRLAAYSVAYANPSGQHAARRGLLKELVIGPFVHKDIAIDDSSSNVLGLEYLSQFLVTIDVPGQRLYLKPGKKFNKPWPRYECGLGVLRHDGRTLAGPVYDGGAAMSNGIITGDEIIAVNGHGVSNMPLSEVRQRLRTFEATQVTLELSREGVHRQVVLTTENVFKHPAEKAPSENGHQGRQ